MRSYALFFSRLVFLVAFVNAHGDHDHDHDHVHPCACEAEELGFTIDCGNQDEMTQALADLQSNGCATTCDSDICIKSFYIVQSHHDYCFEDEVPPAVEEGLHDFETICADCEITPKANPDFPACPEVSCKVDNEGIGAYNALLDNGCIADCSSQTCIDNYRILVGVHDKCPEYSLTEEAEEGLHDLEKSCAANGCNAVPDDGSQLICQDEGATSPATHATPLVGLVVGALAAAIF